MSSGGGRVNRIQQFEVPCLELGRRVLDRWCRWPMAVYERWDLISRGQWDEAAACY